MLIHGLERTPPGAIRTDGMDRPPAFAQLNQARELVETRYRVPLIVWCEPYTYSALRRHAPDLFDHFTGLVRFASGAEINRPRGPSRLRAVEVEDAPRHSSRSSAAAVRFYEQRLEGLEPSSEDHTRALIGLAEALVDRESEEGPSSISVPQRLPRLQKSGFLPLRTSISGPG